MALAALMLLTGCQPFTHYHAPATPPIPSAACTPTEKDKMSLPPYRIQPPDLLHLEVLKYVPLPPYRLDSYDIVRIEVLGTLVESPVNGLYSLDSDGRVNLGAAYGSVRIAGLTLDQARDALTQYLGQVLAQPEVSITLAEPSQVEGLSGIYLVDSSGVVNLREYGVVPVAGKTVVEARLAIERQLSLFLDNPKVSLEIAGFNSQLYYVVAEGAGLGDTVIPVPITGNETVLDAISQVGGFSQLSTKSIFIARPGPPELGCEQILPVDWQAVVRGQTATNYQLLPGDRVYVVADQLRSTDIMLAKLIDPVERLLGITNLGTLTIRNAQTLGRAFNRNRDE